MRNLGIAVVTRTGQEASRLRAFGRGLVVWPPLIAILVLLFRTNPQSNGLWEGWQRHPTVIVTVVSLGIVFFGGGIWAVLHPERGLQDRIAGTSLVPR